MNPTTEIYSELQAAYSTLNARLFAGQLPACLITLQRRDARSFGYYSCRRFGARVEGVDEADEITLNPLHFKSHGPREALQTLAHEMCHLWQYRCASPSRKGYHDKQWADKMEAIGLMPSDTGKPGGKRTGQHMADYVIEGGQFESVASELLAGGFRLAWYDRALEMIADAMANQAAAAAAALGTPLDIAPTATATKPNRSKVKFTCAHSSCKAKAWGKPTLNIVCGEHGEQMGVAS